MKKLTLLIIGLLMSATLSFGQMPSKAFVPYVDVMLSPTFDLMSCYNATGQKYYTLAFIISGSNGKASWGGTLALSSNHMLDQVNNLKSIGGDVIISFGGANGTPICASITDLNELVAAYQEVVTKYNLTWIDFDIEGTWVVNQASIDRRNQAAKILQTNNPGLRITYCLPVMPTGLTGDGVKIINKAKAAGVDIYGVNVMAMDYGSPNSTMGQAAIDAANNTRTQTNLNIGITPMIGQNDTQGEIFSLANAAEVLAFANSTSWVNMIAMWSVTRDNGGCAGSQWASATCSGVAQSDFAYVNAFKSYSGGGVNPPVLASITVSPSTATVNKNQTQQFNAQGKDASGNNMYANVSWTATGGTISSAGLFTATTPGSFTVTATSGSISGTASGTVTDVTPVLTTIVVTPSSVSKTKGETQQYTAQAKDQLGNNMDATIIWIASGGTINNSGLYTSSSVGSFTITATSGSVSGTATVTVNEAGQCSTPQYVSGTTYANGASVSNVGKEYECKIGGWCSSTAAWAYEPGVGSYWADAWTEIGTCTGGTTSVLSSIVLNPLSASIAVNGTQQFIAQGKDQNGNNMTTTITWSANGGTVNASGLFTGTSAGTYTVTATSESISGTATVTVSATTTVLTSITVSPVTSTIDLNATQQLTAQGKDQNGNNMNATFAWLTTGGTVSSSGLFTGTTEGTHIVTASSGAINGTASVTVTTGGNCNVPTYVENGGYSGGSQVENGGVKYECKPFPYEDWCNGAAWAYEPGAGLYWADAWIEIGPCTTLKSSQEVQNFTLPVLESKVFSYPNPFVKLTNINFTLLLNTYVELKVYTNTGTEISTLLKAHLSKGQHKVEFDGSGLPSGHYIYTIQFNNKIVTGNIIKE